MNLMELGWALLWIFGVCFTLVIGFGIPIVLFSIVIDWWEKR